MPRGRRAAGRCRPLDGAARRRCSTPSRPGRCKPLPRKPFVLATWSTGRSARTCHVKVGKTLYSVPWRLIGQQVDARATAATVQIFDARARWSRPTPLPRAREATDYGALPAGEDRVPHAHPGLVPQPGRRDRPGHRRGDRRADGGQRAATGCAPRKASSAWPTGTAPARLEAACARALEVGDPRYRTDQGHPRRRHRDHPHRTRRPAGDGGAAAFLHGPDAAVRQRRGPAHAPSASRRSTRATSIAGQRGCRHDRR